MTEQELRGLLDELRSLPHETEWVEFKCNNRNPQEIGEYLSALSNAAKLHYRQYAYLVFGLENETHKVVGTRFKPRQAKKGNEPLEAWLAKLLDPRIDFRIHEFQYKEEIAVVIFEIDAARSKPVKFSGTEYIRVGESKKKLADFSEKERRLWQNISGYDWSEQICKKATVNDLVPEAIEQARKQYIEKNPRLASEVGLWDDITFLNKVKLTINGKITRSALLLLGKDESVYHLSPYVAKISWILRDGENLEIDYAHFTPPFILNINALFKKIRNITIRHLPDGTLFPLEISQYDPWIIREALHNAIAHQDYELRGKINLVEKPDELVFSNDGSFIPGSVEEVIKTDAPPSFYRNPCLANAMVELNMIDTIGSGIKRMFLKQRQRFFPLPDFDLTRKDKVIVKIQGKILDKNYTQLLISKTDLDLSTVMLLDKVQKKMPVRLEETALLRRDGLIEGKRPNIYISSYIASITGQKATYIKQRGLDDGHYVELVTQYLKKYGSADRKELDDLLMSKLPEILTDEQKLNKINMLLSRKMRHDMGLIKNVGSARAPKWVLVKEGSN
jgi:ATP-dependent DNA helicase RecG